MLRNTPPPSNSPVPVVPAFRPAALGILDACASLGIGRSLLYRLISEKQIKAVKIAGRTVIPTAEIDAFLSRLGGVA